MSMDAGKATAVRARAAACVAVALVGAVGAIGQLASAAEVPSASPSGHSGSPAQYDLTGVSAVRGTSDAWSIGVPLNGVGSAALLRFDGTRWAVAAKSPSKLHPPFPG